MHPFDILSDPVRRRIFELLARGETAAGDLVAVIAAEFGITQPAVSQHLRVLRENGFATVRPEAQRRLYSLRTQPFAQIEQWLTGFHAEVANPPAPKKKHKKRKKDKAARALLPKLPKRRKPKG
jgi:DNA-binding transcriptional ArsR family regulator